MYEIEFHHDADEEMKAAAVYYEERVTGLGSDFLDEIDSPAVKLKFLSVVAAFRSTASLLLKSQPLNSTSG